MGKSVVNQFDTDEVSRRLTRIRKRDVQHLVFGSNGHRYRLRPTIDETTVVAFETRYGIQLPQDYRRFLLHVGNGGAGPFYGILGLDELYEVKEDYWGDLTKPFPYSDAWSGDRDLLQAIDVATQADDDRREQLTEQYWTEMTHDGAIIICEYGCCLRYLLVINGDEHGHIWFDQTADLAGYAPVGINPNVPAEQYADWCVRNASAANLPRTTFGEWYNYWLDWADRFVECATSNICKSTGPRFGPSTPEDLD
jgi:hypothetical protein